MNRERFKDALWFNNKVEIVIGGAGGIGSWLSFFLTRAGFNVTVYDFDTVEEHNLGGQLFFAHDIGQLKVTALKNVITEFNDTNFNFKGVNQGIVFNTYMYHNYSAPLVIYVSAFDNMEARTDFFNLFIRQTNDRVKWFVDGRLLMEQMRIYCIRKSNKSAINDYMEHHLFLDSDVEDLPCTMKQVSHGAAMIATHMTGFITNIVSNELVWKEEVFKVPYMWDYIIPTNCVTEKQL